MIKHFVGDNLSVSMIDKGKDRKGDETVKDGEDEWIVRIAIEEHPDQYLDLEPAAWSELAQVVTMIEASHQMAASQPHIIMMPQRPEEDGDDKS